MKSNKEFVSRGPQVLLIVVMILAMVLGAGLPTLAAPPTPKLPEIYKTANRLETPMR